jgi:hypothetical protein
LIDYHKQIKPKKREANKNPYWRRTEAQRDKSKEKRIKRGEKQK